MRYSETYIAPTNGPNSMTVARPTEGTPLTASGAPAHAILVGAYGAGGLGLVGGISEERVVAHPEVLEWSVQTARDWEPIEDSSDRTSVRLGDGKKALRRCFGDQSSGAELLVEVDRSGKVGRCESRNADSASAVCACRAFAGHGHGSPH
jgi:hypothetical protein